MATKLLHERLHDYVDYWYEGKTLSINGETHGLLLSKEASDLAAEIERFYIPRPRLEDGEPVLKGCEVEGGVVHTICVSDTGFELIDADGNYLADLTSGEMVKRPSKVLDADGVPIEADDVVYRLGDPKRLKVADPHATLCGKPVVECVVLDDGRHPGDYPDADAVTYEASELTHKEPDSLEKLRDDVARTLDQSEAVFPCGREGLEEIRDRLTALMERGA